MELFVHTFESDLYVWPLNLLPHRALAGNRVVLYGFLEEFIG